ncbi:MAG TPA: HAMP domain-containing sensor histidine kinase [Candidatus Binatia bacterium]
MARKELGFAILLIVALALLGYLLYAASPGPRQVTDWRSATAEGLLFLFVLVWNVVILPQHRTAKMLCLGSFLFLIGSFADFTDNFFLQPRWGDWLVEDVSLALGGGLMALGIWAWVREKDRLLAQLQKERDFEASLIPKLSHDLRVPLGNVVGMTGLVESDPAFLDDPRRRRDYFDVIRRAVNDMTLLIDNILETYRIKSGTLRLSPSAVSLAALLDESLRDFFYPAEKRGIALVKDFPGADVELVADRIKVVRVIQNLLANAVKFSPRGGKVVLSAKAENGGVTVRVVDEGPGVQQERLAPAEEKAAVLKKGSEGPGEGFGLGLKVVREFVRLHGGRFWIEPNSPKGAQCCFFLPQRQASPQATL